MNISTAFRLLTAVFMMTAACEAGPTLLLAGDSTLADYGRRPRPPYASWGTEMEKSMKPGCKVNNFAKSGASTKSFIEAGYWAKLVAAIKPGDYVGIQFGHNDQKCNTKFYLEKRFAPPDGLFKDNVRKFVSDIRAKGAKPILMSPIVRGTFGKDGKLYDNPNQRGISLQSYRTAMRELSEELKTDYVDMNQMTRDLMNRIGKEESMKFFVISTGLIKGKDGEPSKDTTHPIAAGAQAFSKLFIDDVKARRLDVAELFN
jgi:lysophospholipase L1-like esterase